MFLTSSERDALKDRHRQEKDRRVADRIKAVLLSDKGWSYRQIAEALLLHEQTASDHVEAYRKSQKLTLCSGGSASKLNKLQTTALIAHVETITYLKVSDICAHVTKTYGVTYTIQGMTSWMHAHGFSYKKPKGTPSKADPAKQGAFIEAYSKLCKTTPPDEPILFGDGVHPTMATKATYGWIKKGTSKPIGTIASRTRINLVGSLNLPTMQLTIGDYETIDSMAMTDHFDQLKLAYPKANKLHLILDRGAYNRSKMTAEAAKKRGIMLHFLPPYSPNLNPIERLWKVMNEQCRNNVVFSSAKEFRRTIDDFFTVTWPKIAPQMSRRINDNFQRLKAPVSA